MTKILSTGRTSVTCLHSSVSGELLKKQKQLLSEEVADHKLIMDVSTRWNSSLSMLQRLCKFSVAVFSLVATSETTMTKAAVQAIKNNACNFEEQAIAEKLISVLEPFKCETEILCVENNPTMHKVLPVVIKLSKRFATDDEDPPVIRSVKSKRGEELEKRTETEKVSIAACVLIPYCKNFKFMPSLEVEVLHCY